MLTETASMADVVFPATSWGEKEGTLVGATGLPQQMVKCLPETGQSVADWKILRNLARVMQHDLGAEDMGALVAEIAEKVDLGFDTSGFKPSFVPAVQSAGEAVDKEYPFTMVTGILMQHSGSLSTLSKSLGSVVSDAYLQISPDDAARLEINDEDFVRVTSRRGEVFLKARVTDEIPAGMLFVPAHFPHARVNALTYPATNGNSPLVAVNVEPAVAR